MLCNRNDSVWHKNEFISIDRYDWASKAIVVWCCGTLGCCNRLQRDKERRETMNPELPHNTTMGYDLFSRSVMTYLVVVFLQTVENQ